MIITPSNLLAGAAVFVALGGTAVAANSLIRANDIAPGAITGKAIRDGAVDSRDLSARARARLNDERGATGAKGDTGFTGATGTAGVNGANGPSGVNGVNGAPGVNGTDGEDGADGVNGANGANGPNGANGIDGTDGTNGTNGTDGADGVDGTNGTDGADGTITPLSATKGLTVLPTASPPLVVVERTVPAGNYVVLAKTQLFHSGAGDSVECTLKAGTTTLDQIAMKTLPALASIPASLQAVTTVAGPTALTVQCEVAVADGTANFSSLIAIPTA